MSACQWAATRPCPSCPWRKTSNPDGSDIPGFDMDKMRGLANTVGHGDAFRPIMACHGSTEGNDRPCIGYLAQEGWSNLAVRMAAIDGRVDLAAIAEDTIDIDLWPTFHDMLHAWEHAR